MTSPTQTEPPFMPLRHTGWASKRTPLWVFAVIAIMVIGGIVVSVAHKPSPAQRAGDLTGYFGDVTTGIGSCAAGLRDSMTAYQAIAGGAQAKIGTAVAVLTYGAANCEVASSQPVADLASYQVTESLASLGLDRADSSVITWAFSAVNYQHDMLAVLRASTPAARAQARAALAPDLATLNASRPRSTPSGTRPEVHRRHHRTAQPDGPRPAEPEREWPEPGLVPGTDPAGAARGAALLPAGAVLAVFPGRDPAPMRAATANPERASS